MTGPVIKTPRGQISLDPKGRAKLEFNTNFEPRFQRQYTRAQKFVDSEVLRTTEKFIPLLTGTLIKSGILGTEIGSGLVQWIAPYAKPQYYSPRSPGSQTGPLRGPLWFERSKAVNRGAWVSGAKKLAGGG